MNVEPEYVIDAERFAWRSWAGDVVIFDRLSGDSWMMERPAGRILEFIAERGSPSFAAKRDCAVERASLSTESGREPDKVLATLIELGILIRFENTRSVD
ncbi:MAG TPA: hypothetical protein PLN31_18845 [Azoarcus taiwanensis]|nr:hypothetical protein [Azoarcus taiwanensis]